MKTCGFPDFLIKTSPIAVKQIKVVLINKKPDYLLTRQPGYLYKTRGFPSPDYSGFGFL
jgi:hypothetical protein